MEFLIAAVVLGPLALMGLILYYSVAYSEGRMATRIGERYEFQVSGKSLSKPDWQLSFHHQTVGRSTQYSMGYEVHLKGLPAGFHLVQRGTSSSMLSQHGMASEQSGDEDFDGLFHHQGGALKSGQRGLLVDLWQLLPDFSISRSKISGQLTYEQSPQGLARLIKVVERLQSLQKEFPGAETHARTQPVGFVRRQKLSQETTVCWAGAAIAGAPALGYAAYAGLAGFSLLDFGTPGCLLMLATALSFVNCAFKVSAGSYAAVGALEVTRRLALGSGLVVIPLLIRSAPSPIGATLVGVVMLWFLHLTLGQLKQKWQGMLDR